MARSDLIISLIKAGIVGDTKLARSTAEAIAADEHAKRHTGVSNRINKVLDAFESARPSEQAPVKLRVRDGSGGIEKILPNRSISSLQLAKINRNAFDEIVEEQLKADILRAGGLEPRHRLLLIGPPGNGKTSLAEALAFELALPLFKVRYDAIITSYLGETAQRLRRLFDYVKTEPCVLFFDEFDAIGKERGDIHETGEIKRVVTNLLLEIDSLPTYCVFVCATNHPELLDKASWRRFEIRLNLSTPSDTEMKNFFSNQLKQLNDTPGYTAKRLFEEVQPTSYSEAENFFLDIKRRYLLGKGETSLRSVITDRIRAWNDKSDTAREIIQNASKSTT